MPDLRILDPGRNTLGWYPAAKGIKVSWKRNGAGAATWSVPHDASVDEALLDMQNLIEVRDDRIPHLWHGVLGDGGPTSTDETLSALSAEALYAGRLTSLRWALDYTVTPGTLMRMLHDEATRYGPLAGIVPGRIETNGPSVGLADFYTGMPLTPVADAIDKLVTWSGGDWWVEDWQFNYARSRGVDRSGAVILSGDIVDYPAYKVSGAAMATALFAVGGGESNDPADHIVWYLEDRTVLPGGRTVIDKYGLIQKRIDYPDIIDLDQLALVGGMDLAKLSRPARSVALNVDERSGNWSSFWVGDTVRAIMSDVRRNGLDIKVKVDSMEYDFDADKLGLVAEIIDSATGTALITRRRPA